MAVLQFPGAMTPLQREAFIKVETEIMQGIAALKAIGVAQGLIVALLHGHALQETRKMLDNAAG